MVEALAILSILLYGLMAGLFYGFSLSVMRGLDRIDSASAIHAMRAMNTAILQPIFFLTFFVTPFVTLVANYMAASSKVPEASGFFSAASLVYILGVVVVTMKINVPMNDKLATEVVTANNAADVWKAFSGKWRRWNTIRCLFSLLALLLSVFGLILMARAS